MRKIVLSIIACTACLFAGAQNIDGAGKAILEKIKAGNEKHTSITGGFKQKKHISVLGEDIISGGMFFYEKPDKMAMRYNDPEGDLMIVNGDLFVMLASGKRRETTARSNAKMRGMRTILVSCLDGDVTRIEAVKIACIEDGRSYTVSIDIDPSANKSGIGKTIATYEKQSMSLAKLETIEPDGSITVYELTGKKINAPIDGNVFVSPKQ